MVKAAASLEFPKPTLMAAELENNDKEDGFFIHVKYDPRGISRQQIRTIFDEICDNFNDTAAKVERVTIALSHATYLKDELTSAKLYQPVSLQLDCTLVIHGDYVITFAVEVRF